MNLQKSNANNQTTFTPAVLEGENNVLDFPSKLRRLRKNIDPSLIRKREKRSAGVTQLVDYIEWHTVADILDETASTWTHSVKDIRKLGEIITVTVAITIDGVAREGIGTGSASSETGIKKAEHDALKRAAVKFGIARDLYRHTAIETVTKMESVPSVKKSFSGSPMAKSLSDLVTGKQLRMIRALSRELELDANKECDKKLGCNCDELSKKAASSLIDHLQNLKNDQRLEHKTPIRQAS